MSSIVDIVAREILDSRGNPTVEADVLLESFDPGAMDAMDKFNAQAIELLTSPAARRAFDLSLEPKASYDHYNTGKFGLGCLLARRLTEAGGCSEARHQLHQPQQEECDGGPESAGGSGDRPRARRQIRR